MNMITMYPYLKHFKYTDPFLLGIEFAYESVRRRTWKARTATGLLPG